jgi:DNA-binding transcriptional ArsR family regulator
MPDDDLDGVWKALSDSTRRSILDLLRQGPRTTTQIVEAFPHLSRFGVMKHIDVLREAGLIHTREERRQRINSLNVVPIRQIYERWVGRFEELWASHLLRIKEDAEARAAEAHVAQAQIPAETKKYPKKGLTNNAARTSEARVSVRNPRK